MTVRVPRMPIRSKARCSMAPLTSEIMPTTGSTDDALKRCPKAGAQAGPQLLKHSLGGRAARGASLSNGRLGGTRYFFLGSSAGFT
jgi:hypothetical protein